MAASPSCDVDHSKVGQEDGSESSVQPSNSINLEASTEDEEPVQNTVDVPVLGIVDGLVQGTVDTWHLVTENYGAQQKHWPSSGKHILAQFDDMSIVVYQAFKHSIADFAIQHQRFGGPHYSLGRMTWIKTNFLWMMYRCGWAQKADQERVLAIRLSRDGFDHILSQAFTAQRQKAVKLETNDVTVRLQWDPDHDPRGGKLQRRAIQLGLKGKTLQEFISKYILEIKDITDFVHTQYERLLSHGMHEILTPRERVYKPHNSKLCDQIGLDFCAEQTVVSFGE